MNSSGIYVDTLYSLFLNDSTLLLISISEHIMSVNGYVGWINTLNV